MSRIGVVKTERNGEAGFTLVEVMVAAIVLLLVFYGIAQLAAGSRSQLHLEGDRRHAVSVAQSRIECIRRVETYDRLPTLADRDTTYTVEGRPYTVVHTVTAGSPESQATTLTVTVSWNERIGGSDVPRSVDLTTILGRGIPWAGAS